MNKIYFSKEPYVLYDIMLSIIVNEKSMLLKDIDENMCNMAFEAWKNNLCSMSIGNNKNVKEEHFLLLKQLMRDSESIYILATNDLVHEELLKMKDLAKPHGLPSRKGRKLPWTKNNLYILAISGLFYPAFKATQELAELWFDVNIIKDIFLAPYKYKKNGN